jgi:hypothetical protein
LETVLQAQSNYAGHGIRLAIVGCCYVNQATAHECAFGQRVSSAQAKASPLLVRNGSRAVVLHIGGDTLQPLLREMKNNLRSKRYA